MDKIDFIKKFEIKDSALFLEPWDVFSKGIVGITPDHNRIVYSYLELQSALAEDYQKEWESKSHSSDEEVPDFYVDAMEWLDVNTLPSLPYYGNNSPIVLLTKNQYYYRKRKGKLIPISLDD